MQTDLAESFQHTSAAGSATPALPVRKAQVTQQHCLLIWNMCYNLPDTAVIQSICTNELRGKPCIGVRAV